MLAFLMIIALGCSKQDEPNDGGNNNSGNGGNALNGHEYVDLGLPSGTLWATCNVGAAKPEEYGDYFAWGETEPKNTYHFGTYKHSNHDYNELTKYCNISEYGYYGYTDNLTILESGDDAATAKWGNDWHTPTKDDWEELYQNTISSWVIWNDINGRLFTSLNGNSLFLPASGYRHGESTYLNNYSNLYNAGVSGYYWSSSLCLDAPCYAWRFFFNSDHHSMYSIEGDYYRSYGLLVRPVHSTN